MAYALLVLVAVALSLVGWFAWTGHMGLKALVLLALAMGMLTLARRRLTPLARRRVDSVVKVVFTVLGFMALLRHPIEIEGQGGELPVYEAIARYIAEVDRTTFVVWALVATFVKFIGVVSSAYAWHLLLVGQRVRFPFWSQVFTAFLIGRFIGTFLPSTLGLDGYTLFEAGRYSNQWSRAVTAKALEKFIGITGLFLGMLLTLPFGYPVLVDVMAQTSRPDGAPLLAGAIAVVAGGISGVVVLGLVRPGILQWAVGLLVAITARISGAVPPLAKVLGRVVAVLEQFTGAVGAYRGQVGLLLLALFSKFVTHFTTAMVYYCTALAIGVEGAAFWPIVFGSTIQILGTLIAPTIAGEGAREAFQALLLSKQLGGVAQAVLSGALGFIAAEAATLWGGVFLWTRGPGWRPAFVLVDGQQVDYAWIPADDDGSFDVEKIAAARAMGAPK